MDKLKYNVVIYDLWGNEDGGFEINDRLWTNIFIEIEDSDDPELFDRDIFEALKEVKIFIPDVNYNVNYIYFELDGAWDSEMYVEYKGIPVCSLMFVERVKND